MLKDKIITRPTAHRKIDLLAGREQARLLVKDLMDNEVVTLRPCKGGWTHEALEAIDYYLISPSGWVVYLDGKYIGSSEEHD
ncbi:hypothetical protein JFQ72_004386 [Vibrio parahaemolyticus]|nr:hypothetical protein [Vibrio parahaemolyticus]